MLKNIYLLLNKLLKKFKEKFMIYSLTKVTITCLKKLNKGV